MVLVVFAAACRTHGEMMLKFGAIAAVVVEALRAFSDSQGRGNKFVVQNALQVHLMATGSLGKRLAGDDDLSRALLQRGDSGRRGTPQVLTAGIASIGDSLECVSSTLSCCALGAARHSAHRCDDASARCLHSWHGAGCPFPFAYAKQVLREEGALSIVLGAF